MKETGTQRSGVREFHEQMADADHASSVPHAAELSSLETASKGQETPQAFYLDHTMFLSIPRIPPPTHPPHPRHTHLHPQRPPESRFRRLC